MTNTELRSLAQRAEGIEGRAATRLQEVHHRVEVSRRRRRAAMAVSAVGIAAALAVTVFGLSSSGGRLSPAPDPTPPTVPSPAPKVDVEVPEGQVTIAADIQPGDIRGWELRGSRTNNDPGLAGDTDLSLTVETGGLTAFQSHVVTFCNGSPDTWWVLDIDLGGVDGEHDVDGSMQDGNRALFGSCSKNVPSSVPGPSGDIEPWTRNYRELDESYSLRMFVTEPLTPAAQQCLRVATDVDACVAEHSLSPLSTTDATFGLGVYEHEAAPVVLSGLGGSIESQALAFADGVEYLADRAVVAATGAPRLVVPLPASDRRTIVTVVSTETPALEACARAVNPDPPASADEEKAIQARFERQCVATIVLRVDGDAGQQHHDWYFGEQRTLLQPGPAREITVDVVENDPRNVRYAVVIWEERS